MCILIYGFKNSFTFDIENKIYARDLNSGDEVKNFELKKKSSPTYYY